MRKKTATRAALRLCFADLGMPRGRPLDRLVARIETRSDPAQDVDPRRIVDELVTRWVERVLQRRLDPPAQTAARAAVLRSEAAARWPDAFLADGAVPATLTQALAAALPQPIPPERPLAMPAQSLAPAYAPRLPLRLQPARIRRRVR